jgi:hypothetical protein
MKLKNKILLAASGLLVLSGAAATTGAFAWFTATRTATVAGSNYKVQSNTTDLSITASLSDGGTTVEGTVSDNQSVTFNTPYNLTDVSGDGVNFVKPVFDSNNEIKGYTALSADAQKVQKADGKGYSYWIDIKLTFKATGARQLGIFISDYTFSASTDGQIYKAGRVAFLDSEKATLLGYAAPFGADKTLNYVKGTPSESDNKTSYDEAPVSDLGAEKVHTASASPEAFTQVTDGWVSTTPEPSWTFATNGYIGSTSKGTDGTDGTLSVVERIWIEGTDASCGGENNNDNANLGKSFGLDINFYGVALKA